MMPPALPILFGALLAVVSSYGLGRILLAALRPRLYREEHHLFALIAGSALYSLVVFLLATARLVYPAVLLAILTAVLAGLARIGFRIAADPLPPAPRFWRYLFRAGYSTFSVIYVLNAMAPEMSPDGSGYHLGIVGHYWRAHGFVNLTTNMYAHLSQGVEMLFLAAYGFGRHSAASLVHCAYLLALPLLISAYGRRFGYPAAGAAGALLAFLSPIAGIDGTSAYIDVALACVLFAAHYLLRIWETERDGRLLAPLGIVSGFAYAVKYTGGLAIPYVLGFVLWRLWRGGKPLLRPAALVCLGAALMVAPWVVKNVLWVGNPFSPMANALFPNPYVHVFMEREWSRYLRTYDAITSPLEIPLEVTVRGQTLGGFIGPVFLALPLALLALRWPEGRRLLFAAFLFGAPYALNIGTRFLLGALPFLSLALAMALQRTPWLLAPLVILHGFLSWPSEMKHYCEPYAWRIREIPFRAALRIHDDLDGWLTEKDPSYVAARMLDELVPEGKAVLAFSAIPEAYTTREVAVGFQSAWNETTRDALWCVLIPDHAPRRERIFEFPPTRLRRLRVVQTAVAESDMWSIAEMRLYARGLELPRAPEWRLRSRPNPWEITLAFDNNPLTRWRTWETARPGMYVEVDFGAETEVDRVSLAGSTDQHGVRLRLEVMVNGQWQILSEEPRELHLAPPRQPRRWAIDEVKRRGFDYLLINADDFYADDFDEKTAQWNLVRIAERNGYRLYRIR
ncbi:MAG: glycosyltransferase family 39 protein [Bryobacteraceae bacterium]